MQISFPLIFCMDAELSSSKFLPLNSIEEHVEIVVLCFGRSWQMDMAVTDLPEPDSPTNPKI